MSGGPAIKHDAIHQLHHALRTIVSSSCFHDLSRDELVDHIAWAISTPETRWLSSCSKHGDDTARREIAAGIIDLVYHARRQDPLSALPTDIGVYILGFFDMWDVARMRAVNKEWCNLGNARLAQERFVRMPVAFRARRRSVVMLVAWRCTSLRLLAATMFGRFGYSIRDIRSVVSACHNVRALFMTPDPLDPDVRPFCSLLTVVKSGAFRSLVTLSIGLRMTDADVNVMAGRMPSLRALCITWTHFFIEKPPMLTSQGLATLINSTPFLTVLYLNDSVDLNPIPPDQFAITPTTIRRLSLPHYATFVHGGLDSMLSRIGAGLRSLALDGSQWLNDASVQIIADRCPHLESIHFDMCFTVTSACLLSIAQLTCLQEAAVPYPMALTNADMDWLMEHTRSPVLKDYRETLRECNYKSVVWNTLFSFEAMCRAEGLPVIDPIVEQ